MRDQLFRAARPACLVLGAALAARVALAVLRPNPLSGVVVPAVPTLASATAPTNAPATPPSRPAATNAAAPTGTNAPARTNSPAGTNAPAKGTNAPAPAPLPPGAMPGGLMPMGMGMGMPMGRGGPGGPPKPLDPLAQARLDRVIQSEIFGPIPRPMPLALLGIAGTDAFLRTTNGMSGMVHEGAEFGGIKLLRIGVNRVLVEDGGTQKELTIFNGAGGDSLLPKPQSPQP